MKKTWIWILVGCVIVVAIVFGIWFLKRPLAPESPAPAVPAANAPAVPAGAITQVASPESAYDIAASHAKQWEPDAALMEVDLDGTTGGQWTFIFVSGKVKGKGLQVIVDGQAVSSTNEIVFNGSGVALPANIISPDAAIAEAHSIPGYGNVAFVSLQMIYNASSKQWYWGVKASNGVTLTVNALP